ncbi:MAG TPA: thiamine pyrophosphate-dependent enzyme, partial [Pyrinomonadaceae bacterium]|nr:thiamine pyrophosphate-dependent enzyme [Pyrinomonadaceae bacterium]
RYLPEGEIEMWEKRDPVERYERHLLSFGIATREQLDAVEVEIAREVDEDVAWAESSPMPEPEKAAYNVFDNSIVAPAFRPKVFGD